MQLLRGKTEFTVERRLAGRIFFWKKRRSSEGQVVSELLMEDEESFCGGNRTMHDLYKQFYTP